MSFFARIVVGLLLGVAVGLFLGEPAAMLQPVGDIYIRLMQMTVLPYMVLALVVGFGQLDPIRARRLALRGGVLLLAAWVSVAAVIVVLSTTFPSADSASFFSRALVEPPQPFSFTDLFFPSNPFHSLANAVVPAVALFSSLLGIFLIGVPGKQPLLDLLRTVSTVVERITRFVISLTPVGVFALAAGTAGTMDASTFARVGVYFVVFAAASVILTFWILPLAVSALTPFRYREILGVSRDALLTAFVASSTFMVLPMLIEQSKELLRRHGLLEDDAASAPDVLVPILFIFPNAGRLLTLLFVPFTAWLSGSLFELHDFLTLFVVGIPSYFAKAQVALPFLMDLFGLPHDLFHLYIPAAIVTGKFDSMVAAMNLMAFALIGGAAAAGALRWRGQRVLRTTVLVTVGLLVSTIVVDRLLSRTRTAEYSKDIVLANMHRSRGPAPTLVHEHAASVDSLASVRGDLDRMRQRGTLRVGYDPGNLPFSFVNADGELVGFDVELAQELASALGLEPEFVAIDWTRLPQQLETGAVDVMPSMWIRPYWFATVRLSMPYMTGTMGLATLDERRHEFDTLLELRRSSGLKIGVPLDRTQIRYSMERYFGGTDVEFVVLETWKPFFAGQHPEIDAFLLPVEGGAAHTLLQPRYTVVVPQPHPVRVPYAFGVALQAEALADRIDEWILFADSEGMIQDAYNYWVLGEGAKSRQPRWSIARDVLGWMD